MILKLDLPIETDDCHQNNLEFGFCQIGGL